MSEPLTHEECMEQYEKYYNMATETLNEAERIMLFEVAMEWRVEADRCHEKLYTERAGDKK